MLLPVWAGKDIGKWSVFGGGGYLITTDADSRNHWVSGLTVTRQVTERLNLGAEIYHQGPDAPLARPFTGVNLGGTYAVTERWSVLFSAGPGIQNAREGGQYSAYLALQANF